MNLYNADTTQLELMNGNLAHHDASVPVQPLAHRVMFFGVVPLPYELVACATQRFVSQCPTCSTQLVRRFLNIEYAAHFFAAYAVVFEHPVQRLETVCY